MSLLPIIVAVITAAATLINFCMGPSFKTSSLPTSHISYPAGDPTSVVVLLSDANGWNADEEEASETLREDGAVVVASTCRNITPHSATRSATASISSPISRI